MPVPTDYVKWGWGMLNKAGDDNDTWHFGLWVPIFDQNYNEGTDPLAPYPNILYLADQDYAIVSENFTADDGTVVTGDVPHADLGSNLKIQVYAYSYD